MNCNFCHATCKGDLIIRSTEFEKTDGSDTMVCGDCLNLFANHEYDKLIERMNENDR